MQIQNVYMHYLSQMQKLHLRFFYGDEYEKSSTVSYTPYNCNICSYIVSVCSDNRLCAE